MALLKKHTPASRLKTHCKADFMPKLFGSLHTSPKESLIRHSNTKHYGVDAKNYREKMRFCYICTYFT